MKILLIDGYNMIHRARYGFGHGDHATTFNFFRQLKHEIDIHHPDIVYLVDEGRPTLSLNVDSNYKGNRPVDPDESFHRQKSEIFEIAKTILGIRYAKHPERECDDVISHIATKVHPNDDILIVSSDTDFIQLMYDRDPRARVQLYNPIKKQKVPPYDSSFGDYVSYKSLIGDPTDNVPGVPGIGPKTALKLLACSHLLKNTLVNEYFEKHPGSKEIFDRAYEMIKFKEMNDDDVVYIKSKFDSEKLKKEFSNREFKSIIEKSWPKWEKTFGGIHG